MIPKKNVNYLQSEIDADVRKVYAGLFEERNFAKAIELWNITGVKPKLNNRMKEIVQDRYKYCVTSAFIVDAIKLNEFSGIRPKLDERTVQEAYGFCFQVGYIKGAKWIRKQTEMRPIMNRRMRNAVNMGYKYFLSKANIELINITKEFTGVVPKMDEEMERAVQEGYEDCFANDLGYRAKDLKKLTGVRPASYVLKYYPEFAELFK